MNGIGIASMKFVMTLTSHTSSGCRSTHAPGPSTKALFLCAATTVAMWNCQAPGEDSTAKGLEERRVCTNVAEETLLTIEPSFDFSAKAWDSYFGADLAEQASLVRSLNKTLRDNSDLYAYLKAYGDNVGENYQFDSSDPNNLDITITKQGGENESTMHVVFHNGEDALLLTVHGEGLDNYLMKNNSTSWAIIELEKSLVDTRINDNRKWDFSTCSPSFGRVTNGVADITHRRMVRDYEGLWLFEDALDYGTATEYAFLNEVAQGRTIYPAKPAFEPVLYDSPDTQVGKLGHLDAYWFLKGLEISAPEYHYNDVEYFTKPNPNIKHLHIDNLNAGLHATSWALRHHPNLQELQINGFGGRLTPVAEQTGDRYEPTNYDNAFEALGALTDLHTLRLTSGHVTDAQVSLLLDTLYKTQKTAHANETVISKITLPTSVSELAFAELQEKYPNISFLRR